VGPISNLRISIVDDDEAVRDSLTGLVESLGAKVRAYSSLAAFMAAPDHAGTDCLLLDCSPANGAAHPLETLAARRLSVPVVAMVRDETSPTRAAALRAGADAVLPRPFTDQALISAIQKAWQRHAAKRGELGLPAPASARAKPSPP